MVLEDFQCVLVACMGLNDPIEIAVRFVQQFCRLFGSRTDIRLDAVRNIFC